MITHELEFYVGKRTHVLTFLGQVPRVNETIVVDDPCCDAKPSDDNRLLLRVHSVQWRPAAALDHAQALGELRAHIYASVS